jgi:cardiolipin synthase
MGFPLLDPAMVAPWFPVGEDQVRLLRDGVQAFPVMLAAIAAAQREVLLEMYWVGNDAVGRTLPRRAPPACTRGREGVRHLRRPREHRHHARLVAAARRAAGGRVGEFHSSRPFDPRFQFAQVELRDHRKLLVVDGAPRLHGRASISRRPGCRPISAARGGATTWSKCAGRSARRSCARSFTARGASSREEAAPLDVRALPVRTERGRSGCLRARGACGAAFTTSTPSASRRARERIDIANSYFVPDLRVRAALFRAVRRGVRVRVLVPHQGRRAHRPARRRGAVRYAHARGVEIWRFPDRMLHAKTAIIDDVFTTIGSFNLDRSLVEKEPRGQSRRAGRRFRASRALLVRARSRVAKRVDPAKWRERSLARRGLEWMSYAVRRLW